ncbi:hypothetical protein [Anaerosporobacter sp.]|uniref:hypothetical protein n=1 Tax=Anaerosporobacter sp. TaxID=1872529 RepID=UPI00286F5B07|nr:hypothetical protein [Anaerosporobacter sp.]
MKRILTKQKVGDMLLLYLYDANRDRIGLSIVPESLKDEITLEEDCDIESLVQLRLEGESHVRRYSHSAILRNSIVARELRFKEQYIERDAGLKTIVTVLENQKVKVYHKVRYYKDTKTITMTSEIINKFINPITIERISSFSICNWPMFGTREECNDKKLYRMRNKKSTKGKMQEETFKDLEDIEKDMEKNIEIESSWSRYGIQSICYGEGNVNSVKTYFPWGVIEDQKRGVCFGAMIAHSDFGKIDVYNKGNRCTVSGGLGNQEGAQWKKTLAKGESFVTPEAIITVAASDVKSASNRLIQGLQELKGIEHFVIDANWYAKTV